MSGLGNKWKFEKKKKYVSANNKTKSPLFYKPKFLPEADANQYA